MVFSRITKAIAAVVVLGSLLLTPTAVAQDAPDSGATLEQLWSDFIHYVRIARTDAALSYGQAIVQADPDPRAVYDLARETSDVERALGRAEQLDQRQQGLAEVVGQIRELIEQGYEAERRDPQRIAEAIDMLDGTLLQVRLATERLRTSGEFALPQLLNALTAEETSARTRERILTVIPVIGREAVRPLSAALDARDPELRVIVARSLGRIGYAHAAPYLKRTATDPDELPRVVQAAQAALVEVAGEQGARTPVAQLFYDLAEGYYNNAESLLPDPRQDMANVWRWEQGLGLTYTPVPSEIFMDVYTMRSARQALEADETFNPAVSLWLAGAIRKEVHLPAGAEDPLRGPEQIDAKSYAKAAGAQYCQQVLIRALTDGDTAVAREIIQPLRQVTGAENIIVAADGASVNGSAPLVAALSYPDREVRYRAAHALALAQPTESFAGDEMVVRVLVDALRQTGQPTALLVDPDNNRRNQLMNSVRESGYEVVAAATFDQALQQAQQSTGVDVVLLSAEMTAMNPERAVSLLRSDPAFALSPVVILAVDARMQSARAVARDDRLTMVRPAMLDAQQMADALAEANAGMGQMDADAAQAWALTAAQTLELLGETRSPVYDLTLAEQALIAALDAQLDEFRIAAADALAVVRTPASQQAVAALALSEAPAEVRQEAFGAAAESVRLIGSHLTDPQTRAVVEFVQSDASLELRDAASALMGAMDLPSDQIQEMITSTVGHD